MSLVIDASVALKWVLDEAGQDAAEALLYEDLIAPDWWLVEAASALSRQARRGNITPSQAEANLAKLSAAPVRAVAATTVLQTALQLAARINHPVYDCLYLALALRERTQVVTADRRFHRAAEVGGFSETVRLLGAD